MIRSPLLSIRPFWALLFGLFFTGSAVADTAAITIDGVFGDWAAIAPSATDPSGDSGISGVDFTSLSVADDDEFLFLRFDITIDEQVDEFTELVLYLDTDLNAATGLFVEGIGADIEWRLGDRDGVFHPSGSIFEQADISFRGQPTVSSPEFEIAVGRSSLGGASQIRLLLRDEAAGGDQIPAGSGGLTYTFDIGGPVATPEITIPRDSADHLRLLTYNVRNDGPWQPGQAPRFGRQLQAIDADVIAFQEIYNQPGLQAQILVQSWQGVDPAAPWQNASNDDCIVVSRLPILQSWAIGQNQAVELDTTATLGRTTLLVNAHLPCCQNETGRQSEIDQILAFVRDAREPGGFATISADTAIVVTGDLNLVGRSEPLESLLEGDIDDEATWGSDVTLDLDGSALESVTPRQTEKRMGYTWRNDNSSFWPGQLDFIIVSDSVIDVAKSFVLYTPEMSPARRLDFGLGETDSEASDHLAFVADFRVPGAFRRGDLDGNGQIALNDVIALLGVLFGGEPNPCADRADVDDNGTLALGDAVALLQFAFSGGMPPAEPFSSCGEDPTADSLDCATPASCVN